MFGDIPTPVALLFAGYIIGTGYIAFLSFYEGRFYKIPSFDKFIISLVFGSLAFSSMLLILNINVNFQDSDSLANFLKVSPIYFFIGVFLARMFLRIWDFILDNALTKKTRISI